LLQRTVLKYYNTGKKDVLYMANSSFQFLPTQIKYNTIKINHFYFHHKTKSFWHFTHNVRCNTELSVMV